MEEKQDSTSELNAPLKHGGKKHASITEGNILEGLARLAWPVMLGSAMQIVYILQILSGLVG